ncbi:MAG TPA: hypothetical protein VGF98_08245 [Candidatus Tumulicola sp.]|jgi:hypothetical protein
MRASTMAYIAAAIGVACAATAAAVIAATPAPTDQATILNSGSTNTLGFKITVESGGRASSVMQNRAGIVQSSVHTFVLTSKQAAQFFTDLKAAKAAPSTEGACMKSASFGSSTHVTWQDWTSPDLQCPSENAAIKTLTADVSTIRTAAGISTFPLIHRSATDGPLHAGSPPPPK